MGDWIPLPTDQNSLRENRLRAHRKKNIYPSYHGCSKIKNVLNFLNKIPFILTRV